MFGNLLRNRGRRKAKAPVLDAHNENVPHGPSSEHIDPEKVRALQTGAALAVSLDASPAVLVNIYDYAQRVRGQRKA